MRALWITNIPFEYHLNLLGINASLSTGGSWLYAAYDASKSHADIQLHIATVTNVKSCLSGERDGSCFYILPGRAQDYDVSSSAHYQDWCSLRKVINPDVVIVWGTESRFAYVAMKAMKGIPMAIYMQGVISEIYKHYYEGMPSCYRYASFRDIFDAVNSKSTINTFKRQVELENEMLKMATGVIVENDWCEDVCKSANSELSVYRNLLPIRDEYRKREWHIESINRYTIFTNAGGYPIKGHHVLLKALSILKKQFPNFKCYIPGPTIDTFKGVKRKNGYIKYLLDLIKKGNLEENVIYTGKLRVDEMVDYLCTCNVYVMPSVLENHSSSLIEAMYVGCPCVSSLVGGTASLIKHKENGLLYNSLDASSLAGSIVRIFTDDSLANSLSNNSLKIKNTRKGDFGRELIDIYKRVIVDKE